MISLAKNTVLVPLLITVTTPQITGMPDYLLPYARHLSSQ